MKCKSMILILTAWIVFPGYALAHNVLSAAYADGNNIEGEIGFSNGEMALSGAVVEVYIGDKQVGSTKIAEDGIFLWQATHQADHRFYANLGAGHVAQILLPADELPDDLPGLDGQIAVVPQRAVTSTADAGIKGNGGNNASELSRLVNKAVAKQVIPLRKEIMGLREKARFQDALGGIGYIFGIFGVAAWLVARQKEQQLKQE